MAVMTPVRIHTMRARPTELAFSNTPFGLTKIPDPIMLPEKQQQQQQKQAAAVNKRT